MTNEECKEEFRKLSKEALRLLEIIKKSDATVVKPSLDFLYNDLVATLITQATNGGLNSLDPNMIRAITEAYESSKRNVW